jgi:hypothetical protein
MSLTGWEKPGTMSSPSSSVMESAHVLCSQVSSAGRPVRRPVKQIGTIDQLSCVLDCVGSVAMLAGSSALVRGLHHVHQRLLKNRWRVRHELPVALSLCLACAGILVTVSVNGGIQVLIVAEVLLLVAFASGRSPYLWAGRRVVRKGGQVLTRCDYVAGLLFVASATAAAQPAVQYVSWSIWVCAPVAARL